MNEQELIKQLKTLKNISPDKEWVNFTRSQFIPGKAAGTRSIFDIFMFAVPRPAAVIVMVGVVVVAGAMNMQSAGVLEFEVGTSPALTASLKHVSGETAEEVAEIQEIVARKLVTQYANTANEGSVNTVVFNKDAEERENFQALLKERIETKIARFNDLFAQLESGESVLEILANPRRYEQNFKVIAGELGSQIKDLLEQAEQALAEGDLITALDLVNAIEKLIEG